MNSLSVDDNDTNQWKSRDINAQDTIYTETPKSIYFRNYIEFQSWKISNSIEAPLYLINKHYKQNIIDKKTVTIGENKETILIIKTGFYNFKKGITTPNEDIFM